MSDRDSLDRRPIASRRLGWVKATSSWLVRRGVSPDAISVSSIVFAGLAAVAAVATEWFPEHRRVLWVAVAVGVQLRLLANLFDGMVAVESGKSSALGELFNEVPDRIADVVVLIALGLVAGSSVHLGYGTAIFAVFVAYLRAVGAVAGARQQFAGVMSKPRRMFAVTVLSLFQALAPTSWLGARDGWLGLGAVGWVLVVILAGCAVTSVTRLRRIVHRLGERDA